MKPPYRSWAGEKVRWTATASRNEAGSNAVRPSQDDAASATAATTTTVRMRFGDVTALRTAGTAAGVGAAGAGAVSSLTARWISRNVPYGCGRCNGRVSPHECPVFPFKSSSKARRSAYRFSSDRGSAAARRRRARDATRKVGAGRSGVGRRTRRLAARVDHGRPLLVGELAVLLVHELHHKLVLPERLGRLEADHAGARDRGHRVSERRDRARVRARERESMAQYVHVAGAVGRDGHANGPDAKVVGGRAQQLDAQRLLAVVADVDHLRRVRLSAATNEDA